LRPTSKGDESGGWGACKVVLNNAGLQRAIQLFNRNGVQDAQVSRIKELLSQEKEMFSGDNLLKVSKAAYVILTWIKAVVYCHRNPHY